MHTGYKFKWSSISITINILFWSDSYRKLEENLLPLKTKRMRGQMLGALIIWKKIKNLMFALMKAIAT